MNMIIVDKMESGSNIGAITSNLDSHKYQLSLPPLKSPYTDNKGIY